MFISCVRFFATPWDCSPPGFPVLHHLLEFAQTHIHWVDDAIHTRPKAGKEKRGKFLQTWPSSRLPMSTKKGGLLLQVDKPKSLKSSLKIFSHIRHQLKPDHFSIPPRPSLEARSISDKWTCITAACRYPCFCVCPPTDHSSHNSCSVVLIYIIAHILPISLRVMFTHPFSFLSLSLPVM